MLNLNIIYDHFHGFQINIKMFVSIKSVKINHILILAKS
jgi:hypothetical protein